MVVAVIPGGHAHQQRRVGVAAIPGMVAHAVHRHAPRLGGRGNHLAPRAHAEGVDPPAVRGADVQLVVRRAQGRMLRKAPVLAAVDEALRMLDAHAHGEGLLHHSYPLAEQALQRVPGAVADGQQHRV